jgi:hypothetical protein
VDPNVLGTGNNGTNNLHLYDAPAMDQFKFAARRPTSRGSPAVGYNAEQYLVSTYTAVTVFFLCKS